MLNRAAELADIESFINSHGTRSCPERFAGVMTAALPPHLSYQIEAARIAAITVKPTVTGAASIEQARRSMRWLIR